MAKKREQEKQRLEKLAETNRLGQRRHRSRSRSYSRSPPRSHHLLLVVDIYLHTLAKCSSYFVLVPTSFMSSMNALAI